MDIRGNVMTSKIIKEMIEVMQHFDNGGEVEYRTQTNPNYWNPSTTPTWDWFTLDYRIKKVDPYAELKATNQPGSGKQIRVVGDANPWEDAGKDWVWCYRPDQYEIRDKPKPVKKVKLLAWFDGLYLFWREENAPPMSHFKRVPMQDKVIEVEE
jgi:hypothetical protein